MSTTETAEVDAIDAEAGASDNDEDAGPEEPTAYFSTLVDWLQVWFLPTWQHKQDQSQVWCPEWWRHSEAIARLEAMWRSWEALRVEGPVGMATWWRDIADYQMSQLLDAHGPFASCRGGHTDDPSLSLTTTEPPPDWFEPDPGDTGGHADWS